MTNYKYFNYKDTGKDLTNKPANIHLIIELDSDEIYFVKITTQVELYHFNITTGVETQIDIDPSNSSGDQKSRDHKIQALWHDRANSIIWGVDCDNDGTADNFDVWKLDYTSSKTVPTVTEVGTSTGGEVDKIYVFDIFIISSNTYVWSLETRYIGEIWVWVVVIRDVDTSPFVEKTYSNFTGEILSPSTTHLGFVTIIGDQAYTFYNIYESATWKISLCSYNATTSIVGWTNVYTDGYRLVPSEPNQWGTTYDGSTYIYTVVYKISDSKKYISNYVVTTGATTIGKEYDIILMLDRNTDSSANPPNNLEKAFHISEDKIYQIPTIYNGRLNLISIFDFTDTIIAITDHYIIDNSLNVYKYIDVIAEGWITTWEVTHDKEAYPYSEGQLRKDKIAIKKNLFMQIIGKYSADQTLLNSRVIFEGKVQNIDGHKLQTFDCIGLGEEMETVLSSGTKSGRTDEIIVDINNDPSPAGCEYITDGTLSVGQSLVNIMLEGDKNYKAVVNHFKDLDKFTWGLRPQGKIDYNNGLVDSGVDLRYNGQSFTNKIWNINTFNLPTGVNRVEVKGEINTDTGVQYTGSWGDEELQQSENVKIFTITDASLNSNSLCNISAQKIGERESTDTTTVQFEGYVPNIGLIQASQTIDFEYLSEDVNVPLDQVIIDRIVVDVISEEIYIEASTGLVFEYMRKSPLEEQPFENSQLILQNARSIYGLQSDINAIQKSIPINFIAHFGGSGDLSKRTANIIKCPAADSSCGPYYSGYMPIGWEEMVNPTLVILFAGAAADIWGATTRVDAGKETESIDANNLLNSAQVYTATSADIWFKKEIVLTGTISPGDLVSVRINKYTIDTYDFYLSRTVWIKR